jgi:aldehyde:ferredoxin oxidoreductase
MLDLDNIIEMGREILRIEKEFNRRAGFTIIDDRLPEFFYFEKLPPKNLIFDVSEKEIKKNLVF